MAAQWSEDFEGASNGAALLGIGLFDTSGVVDTAQYYLGSKAAKHTMIAAQDNALSYGFGKALAANLVQGDEFWVQAWFFYPAGWDFGNNNDAGLGGNATRVKHFRLQTYHANNSNAGYNDVYLHKENSTTTKWQFIYEGVQQWAFNVYGDLPLRPAAPVTGIVRGAWRKIEYYVKLHSDPSQAKVRLWENDSLVFEISDLATLTSSTDYASLFRFCTYVNGGAPQTQSMWTDSWVIHTSSSAPTNVDANGNKFIGNRSQSQTNQTSGAKMPAPTPIASASFTSLASAQSFCGNASGAASFTYDANKGVFLPLTATSMELQDIVNWAQVTGDWTFQFKIEHAPVCIDESGDAGIVDSTNAVQSVRAPSAYSQLLNITSSTYSDAVWILYYYGNPTYLKTQIIENGGGAAGSSLRVSSNVTTDRYTEPNTGTNYSVLAISFDSVARTISTYWNGQLRQTLAVTAAFDQQLFRKIQLNSNGATLGVGAWAKDFALYNVKYNPVTWSPNYTGYTVSVACGVDSFWVYALDDNADWGAMKLCKAALEDELGIGCTIVKGLEKNGQGYYTSPLSNADIDAVIAQSPTFVFISPTPNDLGDAGGFSTGTLATWKTAVENAVNRIGRSGVRYICPMTMWPWVNCASAAGFGGTSLRGAASWTDPSYIRLMNAFFVGLKTNPNIDAFVRTKIITVPDFSTIFACDINGRGYPRNWTNGSHTSGKQPSDVHATPTAHAKVGRFLAQFIARTLLGDGQLFKITSVNLTR